MSYLGSRCILASRSRSAAACRRRLRGGWALAGSAASEQRTEVEASKAAPGRLLSLQALGELGKKGCHGIAWKRNNTLGAMTQLSARD